MYANLAMSRPATVQLLILFAMAGGFAVVGLLLVCLIRGRKSKAERSRPRLAASTDFLRSANNTALSTHVRVRLAFEAIYMCLCEVAESRGIRIEAPHHPRVDVVTAGVSALDASLKECMAIEELTAWAFGTSSRLPQIPVEEVCRLAASFNARAIVLFT